MNSNSKQNLTKGHLIRHGHEPAGFVFLVCLRKKKPTFWKFSRNIFAFQSNHTTINFDFKQNSTNGHLVRHGHISVNFILVLFWEKKPYFGIKEINFPFNQNKKPKTLILKRI